MFRYERMSEKSDEPLVRSELPEPVVNPQQSRERRSARFLICSVIPVRRWRRRDTYRLRRDGVSVSSPGAWLQSGAWDRRGSWRRWRAAFRLSVEHVEDRADQQTMSGLLPMTAFLQRPFRIDQHISDILDVAYSMEGIIYRWMPSCDISPAPHNNKVSTLLLRRG